jgi:hypothetical protein
VIPYVIAGVAGMFFAGRNAPKTKLEQLQCMGPRTGNVYSVEIVPKLGVAIVHAKDGTVGVFQQDNATRRFTWLKGHGNPEMAKAMRLDLEP